MTQLHIILVLTSVLLLLVSIRACQYKYELRELKRLSRELDAAFRSYGWGGSSDMALPGEYDPWALAIGHAEPPHIADWPAVREYVSNPKMTATLQTDLHAGMSVGGDFIFPDTPRVPRFPPDMTPLDADIADAYGIGTSRRSK